MRSSTETLIVSMRVLAKNISSEDGVANAAIAEAADRLEELQAENAKLLKNFMFAESEIILIREDRDELRQKNAALREILINADELERYSGSDGRREWGKCSTWLHADDVVITVSAKAFDAIRKEAQL